MESGWTICASSYQNSYANSRDSQKAPGNEPTILLRYQNKGEAENERENRNLEHGTRVLNVPKTNYFLL